MLLLCPLVFAQFDQTKWRHRAPLRLPEPASSADRFVRATLTGRVLSSAEPGLRDLRLVNREGQQVPYALLVERSRVQQTQIPVMLLDMGVVRGSYQQVVCDLGPGDHVSNELHLEFSSRNFRRRVDVLGSGDRKTWVELMAGRHIFDQHEDVVIQNLRVTYPETAYRFIQLRIWLDGGDSLSVRKVSVSRVVRHEVAPERIPAKILRREEDAEKKATDYDLDTGGERQYLESCLLEISQANFRRRAELSYQDEAGIWRRAGSAGIYRFTNGESVEEVVRMELSALMTARSRLRIWNRDSPALDVTGVVFERMPRLLVFQRIPGQEYSILVSNPDAASPAYDLDLAVSRLDLENLPRAALEELTANPAYRPMEKESPWTERHPALLWAGLSLGVALLGWILLRTLRQNSSRPR